MKVRDIQLLILKLEETASLHKMKLDTDPYCATVEDHYKASKKFHKEIDRLRELLYNTEIDDELIFNDDFDYGGLD